VVVPGYRMTIVDCVIAVIIAIVFTLSLMLSSLLKINPTFI
jgi:hypothetical protein